MPSPVTAFRLGLAVAFSVAVLGNRAQAQESGSIHVNVHVPDTVAHIVDRSSLAKANFAIVSRDGTAALLLMDTTIVAEMTDTGLARMNAREATDTIKRRRQPSLRAHGSRSSAAVVRSRRRLPSRDMADARYADGRLQLVRANGEEVFRDTEIGHGPLMESFTPADARAFAARAREARVRLR